jgi:hypothetical protein
MAEPGPGVKGWDASLVIDCTPAQHAHLQKLIKKSLSSGDWESPRPELGEGIFLVDLPSWDFGVYMSQLSQTLIDDGTGSGTLERACVVGGRASFEAQSKAAPTDTDFVMADGITKPTNQWQETSSKGGLIGGPASVEVRSKNHIFSTPLVWATNAMDSGFGHCVAARPGSQPRYDPIEFGREMDVAISGFFKVGTPLPGLGKRKVLLADVMGLKIRSTKFCAAWDQLKDHKFRLAK